MLFVVILYCILKFPNITKWFSALEVAEDAVAHWRITQTKAYKYTKFIGLTID